MAIVTPEAFGKLIQDYRLRRGWSLREAAKRFGLSHMRLSELERGVSRGTGHATRPSREVVRRMALALGVPIDNLLEHAGYAREQPELEVRAMLLLDLFAELDDEDKALALRLIAAIRPRGEGVAN
ncbi:MAG TPA: helix-turn-helix transcriptional regulator [Oscillatoriaceae cyanobacterium]